jgi:acyl-coenzyme A thioesterase PaaI-like protein
MKERRSVRNHLKSVHAIALANVGELASGIAMLTALPKGSRGIVGKIEIEYFKKARGVLRVEGMAQPPTVLTENINSIASAQIFNDESELVAQLTVTWVIGPKEG